MDNYGIYGAVIGDICGSIYERHNRKTDKPEEIDLFDARCHFTDDTVLTAAIAEAARTDRNYQSSLLKWARLYPRAGYGGGFRNWLRSDNPQPYNSFGNGSAMRVSPIGWFFDTEEEVLAEAKRSAEPTHNHPEGIKGAQAVALAIFLLRKGASKQQMKERIEKDFGYDLSRTLADIRPDYKFDVTCQGSVPVAIIAFLESHDFVSAIQNAISVGGDSDTIAAITGSIAEAHYREVPAELKEVASRKLVTDIASVLGIPCCNERRQEERPQMVKCEMRQSLKDTLTARLAEIGVQLRYRDFYLQSSWSEFPIIFANSTHITPDIVRARWTCYLASGPKVYCMEELQYRSGRVTSEIFDPAEAIISYDYFPRVIGENMIAMHTSNHPEDYETVTSYVYTQ